MDEEKKKVCSFHEWEWSKATHAMKILLNASNLDPAIAANIREINKYIFKIATTDNENTEETSVNIEIDESKLNDMTNDEFHTLLDQVVSPQTKQIKKKTTKEDEETRKKRIADLFCQSNKGWWPQTMVFSSEVTPREAIGSNGKYKIMFDGFYSIQTKLIETQLKETLIKYSNLDNGNNINGTIEDVNYLYSKMTRWRKACAFLPSKHEHGHFENEWPKHPRGAQEYVEMIEYFDQRNNNVLKMYCILSCSLFNIWFKEQSSGGSDALGFGWILYLNQNDKDKSLLDLSRVYLLNQLAYSSIFGEDSFTSNTDDLNTIQDNNKRKNEELKGKKHSKTMKKVLFNNDLTKLDKLLKYCLHDIPDQKNWAINYEMIEFNSHQRKNSEWDTGITFYIMNRMLFGIFNDLMCYKHNDDNNVLFPQLKEFFMFMYNFSVYIHCHPT